MTPDAYVFQGRTYPINRQFRFLFTAATCSKRHPCALCIRQGSWWK